MANINRKEVCGLGDKPAKVPEGLDRLAITWRHYRGGDNVLFEPRATPVKADGKASVKVCFSDPGAIEGTQHIALTVTSPAPEVPELIALTLPSQPALEDRDRIQRRPHALVDAKR